MMERLTKHKFWNVVSEKQEKTGIHCSNFCNNCSRGTGDCKHLKAMVEKLAAYEDAEEQGLLLRLPLKIGDTVYSVTRDFISEYTICSIEKYNEGLFFNWRCEKGIYINARGFTNYQIGKDVFLTQAEAEQKLKEMESD